MRLLLGPFGPFLRGSSLRAQMVRGTGGTLTLKVINSGLMLLISLALARALGAGGYGAYAYAVSWMSLLVAFGSLGLGTLLTREIARYRAIEDWAPLRGILGWSDRVTLSVSIALAAAGAVVLWLLRHITEPVVAECLWAALLMLPLTAILQVSAAAARGLGQVVASQVPMMLVLPGTFLAAVLVAQLVTQLTAVGAISLRVGTTALATMVAVSLVRRCLPVRAREAPPEYRRRMWLKSAGPFLFLSIAVMVSQQIGVIMLGSMIGTEAAGIYDIARRAAALVGLVVLAVNMPLGPLVAGLYARDELAQLQRVVVKSARLAAVGSCLIALVLIALGPWLLHLFGREFGAGLPVLVILCGGQVLSAVAGSVALVLNMTGHERDSARGIGIAAVSQVGFNAVLIPKWGILGAAIGEAASTMLWNALLIGWMWRRLGMRMTVFGAAVRR